MQSFIGGDRDSIKYPPVAPARRERSGSIRNDPEGPDAPEAAHPDRDVGSTDYVAAGVVTAPTYLKWMLLLEEPDNSTVWLAKALPRDWLEPGMDHRR